MSAIPVPILDTYQRPELGVGPDAARRTVTVIPGDGVGPEVMGATLRVLEAAAPSLVWEECVAGARAFSKGVENGLPTDTLESIEQTGLVLKGPLETPVGHGGKSVNVTLRKLFETYGNIRPCRKLPGIETPFSDRDIDMVIVRENVEDLYAGIEHMQTPGVAQCLKLVSRLGCEKIARLAFELATAERRARVTCATKANIMKLTEGMMKRTFEEVAAEYDSIDADHMIVDNCAHMLVRAPERFDVIVTTNMNGDILSDLAAGLVGGLGLASSANLGTEVAIFEPVHGSAPDIAGQGNANPTALLLSAVMMLRHVGLTAEASRVEAAVTATLARGDRLTPDIARKAPPVGTDAFADTVIEELERLGATPPQAANTPIAMPTARASITEMVEPIDPPERATVGLDIFIESREYPEIIGNVLSHVARATPLELKLISNRGTMVWPSSDWQADLVDHWRCRFVSAVPGEPIAETDLFDLLHRVSQHYHWVHVERLQSFDGEPGYSRAQGE